MGRLVDDAIVVIENIFRHISSGKDRQEAAIIGATEVFMPITASTLTTIAVFFPLVFVTGVAGELFKSFPYGRGLCLICLIICGYYPCPNDGLKDINCYYWRRKRDRLVSRLAGKIWSDTFIPK